MLTRMSSPAFKMQGKERAPIVFKEGLNVVLGKTTVLCQLANPLRCLPLTLSLAETHISKAMVSEKKDTTPFSSSSPLMSSAIGLLVRPAMQVQYLSATKRMSSPEIHLQKKNMLNG